MQGLDTLPLTTLQVAAGIAVTSLQVIFPLPGEVTITAQIPGTPTVTLQLTAIG